MINYKLTDIGINNLDNYSWIKNNFSYGKRGDLDNREMIRLLENSHYNHIRDTLRLIDTYGQHCGRIVKEIFACNDPLNLTRMLGELYLFKHIFDLIGPNISAVDPEKGNNRADFHIQQKEFDIFLEIYTPIDFYGFQYFDRLLSSHIKNLDINIGFKIKIDQDADNFHYAFDFPDFKQVDKWLKGFIKEFSDWLRLSKEGDTKQFLGPNQLIRIDVLIEELTNDSTFRCIMGGTPTRSTDTLHYFRIEDAKIFSNTEWGWKISDKLNQQQAGAIENNKLRMLIINMSHSDTSEFTFLNDNKYHKRIENDITYLAKKITPYPPYDVVLLSELGFECGFGFPVNLSSTVISELNIILESIGLNVPVKPIPVASEEETAAAFAGLMRHSKS